MARKPDTSLQWYAAEPPRAEAGTDASGPVRVLLVDDSEAVREGLTLLLNSRPYCRVVGAVDDPHRAMELTREAQPHVVLLDFSMPLVDPLALAAELAACRPRPAVLMLSALASEQSAIRASAAGAVGWILKDAEPDALFTALLRAARSADPAWEARAALVAEVLALGMDAPTSSVLEEIARHEPSDADPAQAAADPATSDAAKKLDARAVRALLRALRALHGDLMGASASELAGHAVVSPRTAERILKRLLGRDPALVARVDLDAPECRYVLTAAGEQELERLERHIAREAGDADAASVACGAH